MSKKRRMFDIDIPDVGSMDVGKVPDRTLRRGPMASAISENASSLRDRKQVEDDIRAENDRLASEFVRLKREGLITDRIALDSVVTERLVRDRKPGEDDELEELKLSIREVGLSNPIRVEARADGRYELIQGMRRLMAFRALLEDTGDAGFATIPAGIVPAEAVAQTSYRRMVDENLVRKDISFAEMASLARRYADDPANACPEVSDAVATLFKSASYTKRSYIRAFAELLMRLDKVLEYPQDIPRNVGVELKRRMDRDEALSARVSTALRAEPERDAAREVEILRSFVETPSVLPTGKKSAAATRPRQAKTTFQVPFSSGVAKCSASHGRLELREDRDFSAIDRRKLELAIVAFYEALET
ncbi:ParB N-terminal domain-containing protein [Salipiger sp. 1_MG-2023]|uniref:ParB/RepB/Spo0J family partition protein n=1 Tax=Salipiger sp. 1_MG-2023 TaxID=3062665 RepID=UPI0026E28486|nr:ParB N-terminal domain-containing protein [Salipiger sp. 1_MG-2023]MDO6588487.1 ParB N-terminal domain-containing protein [Salipiger sp. 1_MG-2023]